MFHGVEIQEINLFLKRISMYVVNLQHSLRLFLRATVVGISPSVKLILHLVVVICSYLIEGLLRMAPASSI
jgi:hypothetical protein